VIRVLLSLQCLLNYSQFKIQELIAKVIFATNSDFGIGISLQPDIIDLGYFKL